MSSLRENEFHENNNLFQINKMIMTMKVLRFVGSSRLEFSFRFLKISHNNLLWPNWGIQSKSEVWSSKKGWKFFVLILLNAIKCKCSETVSGVRTHFDVQVLFSFWILTNWFRYLVRLNRNVATKIRLKPVCECHCNFYYVELIKENFV